MAIWPGISRACGQTILFVSCSETSRHWLQPHSSSNQPVHPPEAACCCCCCTAAAASGNAASLFACCIIKHTVYSVMCWTHQAVQTANSNNYVTTVTALNVMYLQWSAKAVLHLCVGPLFACVCCCIVAVTDLLAAGRMTTDATIPQSRKS